MLRKLPPVQPITRPRPTGPLLRPMTTLVPESRSPGPLHTAIHDKLTALLRPSQLAIANESHLHRHHAPMRARDGGSGESHFALRIVSDAFVGKSTLQRHRIVYSALSDEFAQGLHALSLNTSTADEAHPLAARRPQ